jgi:histidine phosphotransferase ChpT
VPSGCAGLLAGTPDEGFVDARGIQPFYTGILARMTDMDIKIGLEDDKFFFTATPKSEQPAAE